MLPLLHPCDDLSAMCITHCSPGNSFSASEHSPSRCCPFSMRHLQPHLHQPLPSACHTLSHLVILTPLCGCAQLPPTLDYALQGQTLHLRPSGPPCSAQGPVHSKIQSRTEWIDDYSPAMTTPAQQTRNNLSAQLLGTVR